MTSPNQTGLAAQAIVLAYPKPAVLIDGRDRIAALNPEAEAILGLALPERPLITVLRQPPLHKAIMEARRSRTRQEARIVIQQGAQDHSFTVSCAILDDSGAGPVLLCFEDLTQIEVAGQMRRDFVANVSHELRTPLTALMGFIETLQGPARDDPEARQRFLGIMSNEASRMNRLVKDLLSLSQVESEERLRPGATADLGAMLGSISRTLAPLAERSETTIRVTLPEMAEGEAPVLVPADEDQLSQVFMNLMENAIKYGGQGGRVRVTVELIERDPSMRGPAVRVSVADSGPGIDPVHIPRLTERFYRVDSHRSREMGGTGLGLAIVKHIVNRHRGRLRIESEPGRGSVFTVVLPRLG